MDNSTLFCFSKGFQPFKDCVIVTPWLSASSLALHRLNAFDGFALHLKINGGIAVRRVEVGMPQPLTDRRHIHSRLQEGDRRAVPHAVRVEPLGAKTWSGNLGMFQALVQDVSDSETRERCGPAVLEDPHFGPQVNVQLHTQMAQELCRLRPDGTGSLFSAFSREMQLKGFRELKVTSPEIQNLLYSGAGVEHGRKESIISPSLWRALVDDG